MPLGVIQPSSPSSGPGRWVWPKITCSASIPRRASDSEIARRPDSRSTGPDTSGLNGPMPSRLNVATPAGITTLPSSRPASAGRPSWLAIDSQSRLEGAPRSSVSAPLTLWALRKESS